MTLHESCHFIETLGIYILINDFFDIDPNTYNTNFLSEVGMSRGLCLGFLLYCNKADIWKPLSPSLSLTRI